MEIIKKILMNLSLEENLELEESDIIKTKLKELTPERKNELWYEYVKKGNLKVIKVLHKHIPEFCTSFIIDHSANYGHLEVVKYLHSIGVEHSDYAMAYAARNGHLEVVKYLHSIEDEYTYFSMESAAKNGHLDIVKYLYSIGSEFSLDAIVWAAEHGHLDIVKYFHSIGSINGSKYPEPAFILSARNNRLEVVKYLHSIGAPGVEKAIAEALRCEKTEVYDFLRSKHV